ncbi:MAG: sugar isomerase domain-containing protein [Bullifex sp.]
MRKEQKQYHETVTETFKRIAYENPQMEDAAGVIASSIARGQLIHVIGTGGHSNMAAEELLWRAGGLAPINAILDAGTNLIHGAKRSNMIERMEGYTEKVFDNYRVGRTPGEVIIIANAYGINAMTIDAVLEARKRGMTSIAITSKGFADNVPKGAKARHSSGLNLYEEADYFINTFMPYGDAVVDIDNCAQKTAPTSTLCNTFAINMLMLTAVAKLSEMGIEPPLWTSANLPGGDEKNKKLEEQYALRVKHL